MIGFLTSQVGPSRTRLDEPPHRKERTKKRKMRKRKCAGRPDILILLSLP